MPTPDREREIDAIKKLIAVVDDLGETEDDLGIPRSSPHEPWSERVRRIREAAAKC